MELSGAFQLKSWLYFSICVLDLPLVSRVRVGERPSVCVEIVHPQFIRDATVLQPSKHVQLLLQNLATYFVKARYYSVKQEPFDPPALLSLADTIPLMTCQFQRRKLTPLSRL